MADRPGGLKWHQHITYFVITNTEHVFYILGKSVGKKPVLTIVLCWTFVVLSAFGLLRFYQEKNPLKLWVPPESQFVRDSELLMSTFEKGYRPQILMVVADDVLTPEIFKELYKLNERVRNSMTPSGLTWNDVCFKVPEVDKALQFFLSPSSYKKRNKTKLPEDDFDPSVHFNAATYCKMVDSMEKVCYEVSLLDLWGYSKRKIETLTKEDIIEKINAVKKDPLYGNLKNYENLLGGVKVNESGYIVAAKSLTNYWMALLNFAEVDINEVGNYAGTGDWASVECLEWETEFLRIMDNASKTSQIMDIYYDAGRSFGDISGETMFQDMDILMIGIFIMVLYVQFVISKFNCVEARIILGSLGLLAVGMAYVTACGLCSLCGVFYGPVHTSLPFLLMGLGVDDMFVIIACWEHLTEEQKRLPLEERVGRMLQHAGISITITTATDVVAFFIGASTVLPCLQSYCIYAGVGVLLTFVFVITFFLACFTLDQRRIERHVSGIFPWIKYKAYKPKYKHCQGETTNRVFHFIYSKLILTPVGKVCVIGITLIMLGFSLESIFKLEQRFDPRWFIPKNTYLGQYFIQREKYFPNQGYDAGTYIGAVNYTHEFWNIRQMELQMENNSDIITDLSSWVNPFRDYVRKYFKTDLYEVVLPDNQFNLFLSKFLFSPRGARFQANFQFEKPLECGIPASNILISNIAYRFRSFKGPEEYIPAMKRIAKISKSLNLTTGDQFSTAWSKYYATWITDEIIDDELYRDMELSLLAVMLCTLVLMTNLQMCFWVFICILLSMVNIGGFMQRWGVTIDLVSCIGLTLATGLCVDYASHIGHTFLITAEGNRNERALKTITSIGSAVFYGGTSTLIAVSMLAFSTAYNFQTFFKIFLLVVIFGLYHGIVFLPVILSWVGPQPFFMHKLIQQNDNTKT